MNKKNCCQMVTDRIIEQLERGLIPWEKPWGGIRGGAYNRITSKPYSLMNQMILKHTGEYATFHQWVNLGGRIKKGEKAEKIFFWKIIKVEKETEEKRKKVMIPILKTYSVFHISQVENVQPKEQNLAAVKPMGQGERILQEYIDREKLLFREVVSDDAYYSPLKDIVVIPCKEQYSHMNEYYSTAFHEMIHSTGHPKRLGRFENIQSVLGKKEDYSKEELVAEMGSSYLMNLAEIETKKTFRNSAAYIQNWLQVLRNDNRFIVSAASKAEQAVCYILGEKIEKNLE
mgnify:FL=1